MLIGTNLDVLYSDYAQAKTACHLLIPHGYRAVLKIVELRQKQSVNGNLGWVKLQGKVPEVIPAGHTVVLEGLISTLGSHSEKWGIIEPPSSPLPGGLLVSSYLFTLPTRQSSQLLIVLKNETQRDAVIPPKTVLPEVNAIQSVIQKEQFAAGTSSQKVKSLFHCLSYVDAVRKHLHELLEAGIIRESESAFSTPIVVVRKRNNSIRLLTTGSLPCRLSNMHMPSPIWRKRQSGSRFWTSNWVTTRLRWRKLINEKRPLYVPWDFGNSTECPRG